MLQDALQAAAATLEQAQAEVEALTGPTAAAREAAREATVEATRLMREADDHAAAYRRNPSRVTSHAAEDAARPARVAEDAARRARVHADDLGGQLSAARGKRDAAEHEFRALDSRVNADQRAAQARQAYTDAAQAVETAQARIVTLTDEITRLQRDEMAAVHAMAAALEAADRGAYVNGDFDAKVTRRALDQAGAELANIDVQGLRTVAAEARVRAEKLEQRADLERVAASIDWNLIGKAMVLDPATRSVRLAAR